MSDVDDAVRRLLKRSSASKHSNRTRLHDDSLMPIGTHKGKPLKEVPDHWWKWFIYQPWAVTYPDLLAYAKLTEGD